MAQRSDSAKVETHRSSLSVILLGMLFEEPMHAYRMQKSIKQRGVDKIVNVRRRASVYQALGQLLRMGLIEVQETLQAEKRQDTVVYAITDRGREMALAWLPKMLTTIGADFPKFPAAVSLLTMLSPEDARKQFECRSAAVRKELNRLDGEKLEAGEQPRIFWLNNEYLSTMLKAELAWLQTIVADLESGSFAWGHRKYNQVETVRNAAR